MLSFLILTLVFLFGLIIKRNSPIKGIPGPPGNVILGNTLQLKGHLCKTWLLLKKTYGPVFQLQVLFKRFVILNDKASTIECFAKTESAGRLGIPIFEALESSHGAGIIGSTGKHLIEQREFFLKALREFGITKLSLEERLREDIQALHDEWISEEGNFFNLDKAFNVFIVNSAWNLLCSHRFSREEASQIMQSFNNCLDYSTWRRRFCLMFPRISQYFVAEHPFGDLEKLRTHVQHQLEEHQLSRIPGKPRDVLDKFLDKCSETFDSGSVYYKPENKIITGAFRDVLIASTVTSKDTLQWVIVNGCRFPDAVRRVQAEIDLIVGPTEAPSIIHRELLPYTEAFLLEVARLATVTPFSPRTAVEDFEFRGVTIPKNALIISNIYAIHHDPEVWACPNEFKPERFLNSEGCVDLAVKNQMLSFGYGKRSCIGQTLATDQTFLVVVSMYQKFNFNTEESLDSCDGIFGLSTSTPVGVRIQAVSR